MAVRIQAATSAVVLAAFLGLPGTAARADEGGVSFWLPGQLGSLTAVPGEPGWSMPMLYIHTDVDAGGERTFTRGGRLVAGLDARADLGLVVPTYTFAQPVWGGQAAFGIGIGGGHMKDGIHGSLTAPGGVVVSGEVGDSRTGFTDLYPMATVKWNRGTSNYMAYLAGGVPVGAYTQGRLANLGTNHWSVDAGGGYTYLNPKEKLEFSAVAGLTYNFENPDTNYKNGIDGHIDWGASYFVSPTMHTGLVGYFYHQFTGDSGDGARLGDFKSRVNAVGPQVGWFFEGGGKKYYANLKALSEFGAKNRPEGWSAWLSLVVPLGAGKP